MTEQPTFTCPHCSKNLFEVGVVEFVSNTNISTVIGFNQGHMNNYDTQLEGPNNRKQIQCRSCKCVIDMDSDQLDAVFSGRCTEEQMKIQCKILHNPILICKLCKMDIFKSGFYEVSEGGTAKTKITFSTDSHDIDETKITNISGQWSECANCHASIDVNASDLINYYEGECSLEDLISE